MNAARLARMKARLRHHYQRACERGRGNEQVQPMIDVLAGHLVMGGRYTRVLDTNVTDFPVRELEVSDGGKHSTD
jgi:hypothetical protein